MKLEIDVKQALIVSGSIAAGMIIGFGLTNLAIKKAKKELKNEIINKETKMVKEEITNEIKENIDIKSIKKEIADEIKESIIEDTLDEMLDKTATFMAKVNIRLDDYEKELNRMSNEVLNFDTRVGKIINGAIKTVGGIVVKGGDDYED